jgi:hypothetical protein
MTTRFKSQYSEHDAFYLRGDLLRSAFGNWDACDPVAHCILDLVEAQCGAIDAEAAGHRFQRSDYGKKKSTVKNFRAICPATALKSLVSHYQIPWKNGSSRFYLIFFAHRVFDCRSPTRAANFAISAPSR